MSQGAAAARRAVDGPRRQRARALRRAVWLVLLLGFTLPWPTTSAGAQSVSPESVGIGPDALNTAESAMGTVTINGDSSWGWVPADGVVITSDAFDPEVGVAAYFRRVGSANSVRCYVARREPTRRLAALRCNGLGGPVIDVQVTFPSPGDPVAMVGRSLIPSIDHVAEGARIVDNNVTFMGQTRLRFSFDVQGIAAHTRTGSLFNAISAIGAPLVDAQGKVVSTILAAPAVGGQPIGTTPAELRRAVGATLPLPGSFTSAAVVTVGRRAAIPAAVGLVLGLVWGLLQQNSTAIKKALGLAFVGLLLAGSYSLFLVMVMGPQTLLS